MVGREDSTPIINELAVDQKMTIDLRIWRHFIAVAEELHFGRAADRLHMTQPPLTQSIAQLEKILGVLLFDRSRRRVQLTAAGQALLPEARALIQHAHSLPGLAQAAAAGEAGHLRLAFAGVVSFGRLPLWVKEFRSRYPRVVLDLVEAAPDVQFDAFERGIIDAGFMLHVSGGAPARLERLLVGRERLALAMQAEHLILTKRNVTLDDLLSLPLIIFPRHAEPSLYDAICDIYASAGRQALVVQEAIQMSTIVNLVSSGLGIAWVPESIMRFARDDVVYRFTSDLVKSISGRGALAQLPICDIGLIWKRNNANPALQRFIDLVRQDVEGSTPGSFPRDYPSSGSAPACVVR